MLEFFRRHVGGGLLGILLVGLLAVAFAFSFGAQSKGWGEGQTEEIAAVAAGYDISEGTLDYAYNLLGGRGVDDSADAVALRISALEGLIERGLLLAAAKDMGITASSDEAVDRIVASDIFLTRPVGAIFERMEAYPFFNPVDAPEILTSAGHQIPQSFSNDEGEFNLDFYKSFVRNHLRQTEDSFIEQQRLEIIAERLRQLMVVGIRVSEDEVRAEYERKNDTATIRYIRIIPAYFADQLRPSPAELDAWAEAHAEEIKKHYEANQFRYTDLEEQVRARHILVKVDKDAEEAEKAEKRAQIEGILKRLEQGEDFASLAAQFSEDEGSARKGGDLGYTPRGRMVPEFDEAMFALKPSELSGVVETQYGFHIIKVEGVRQGNVSLEDATPEIAEKLYREEKGQEKAAETAAALLERLKAGEAMDNLLSKEEAAKGPLAMKVQTSREFSATDTSIPGVGPAEEMVAAAFEAEPGPAKFEVGGDFYVMEVAERSEPNDEDFAEVKDELAEKLLAMKQAVFLVNQIAAMRAEAEAEGRVKVVYEPAVEKAVTPPPAPPVGAADRPAKAPVQKGADKGAADPGGDKEPASADDESADEEADGE